MFRAFVVGRGIVLYHQSGKLSPLLKSDRHVQYRRAVLAVCLTECMIQLGFSAVCSLAEGYSGIYLDHKILDDVLDPVPERHLIKGAMSKCLSLHASWNETLRYGIGESVIREAAVHCSLRSNFRVEDRSPREARVDVWGPQRKHRNASTFVDHQNVPRRCIPSRRLLLQQNSHCKIQY